MFAIHKLINCSGFNTRYGDGFSKVQLYCCDNFLAPKCNHLSYDAYGNSKNHTV